jgi:hypothetical protein
MRASIFVNCAPCITLGHWESAGALTTPDGHDLGSLRVKNEEAKFYRPKV